MSDELVEETEVANNIVEVGVISVIGGLLVGSGIGYILAKHNLEAKYAAFADQEIAEMREHYRESKDIAAIAKPDLQDLVEDLGYVEPVEEIELVPATPEAIAEVVEQNIFEDNSPESVWNWAEELRSRSEGAPYIIHKDEFVQNEREYTQLTLTYFDDDDVLCDERDAPIDDRDEVISPELLQKFGHGSEDINVLYVRNPIREIDIEIVKSSGSFAEEVHGLKHSETYGRNIRVRRGYDDDEIT